MYESEDRKILLENNRILHKLLSAQRWATFWSVLRWLIVLGTPLVVYYYLQPYLDKLLDAYSQISATVPELKGLLPIKPF
jgi:hypothetical protein